MLNYFDPKKTPITVTGEVKSIKREFIRSWNKEIHTINILCKAPELPAPMEVSFNYSTKWSKLNLKSGDRVSFNAMLKSIIMRVHKDTGALDDWGVLPNELLNYIEDIEIQSPKQIRKLQE